MRGSDIAFKNRPEVGIRFRFAPYSEYTCSLTIYDSKHSGGLPGLTDIGCPGPEVRRVAEGQELEVREEHGGVVVLRQEGDEIVVSYAAHEGEAPETGRLDAADYIEVMETLTAQGML